MSLTSGSGWKPSRAASIWREASHWKGRSLNQEAAHNPSFPSFGIGIPCHNDAQNIEQLLECIASSAEDAYSPRKIVVLSSASTDSTDAIVRSFASRSLLPVVLKTESERKGKASAINEIIRELDGLDIIVLVSGDVLPAKHFLHPLLQPFRNPEVGVVGGRPVPESSLNNCAFKVSQLLWELHHFIALRSPKTTEITAFRNLGRFIDEESLVDEAELEHMLTSAGYKICYVAEVTIRTNAPLLVSDYVRQRFRVTLGHMLLAKEKKYVIGTLSIRNRFLALVDLFRENASTFQIVILALILESAIYLMARVQRTRRIYSRGIWPILDRNKRAFDNTRV